MLNERREARGAKPLKMSHAALLADREARRVRREAESASASARLETMRARRAAP
jgi:hypothetical protein